MKIDRVLFPTDFSRCSEQALDHALFLAREFDAELHMLHAVVLHEDDPNDPKLRFAEFTGLLDRLSDVAESEMARLAAHPAGDGVTIVQNEARGYSAAAVILEHAAEIGADVIVMGTHGRRGAGHFFLGSVAERVVRHAACPVLTLRERAIERPLVAVREILVPIDFSDSSAAGLEAAKKLASVYNARLQLLHVIELQKLPTFYEPFSASEITQDRKRRCLESLEKLAERIPGPPGAHQLHVEVGPTAAHSIVEFAAESQSGLIVIPTHGLTGIERILLGSTAERVIRLAGCPVFTVRGETRPSSEGE